jgi:hypothetical protein
VDGEGSSAGQIEVTSGVADVVFLVLTLAVFGLLALAVRGVERL